MTFFFFVYSSPSRVTLLCLTHPLPRVVLTSFARRLPLTSCRLPRAASRRAFLFLQRLDTLCQDLIQRRRLTFCFDHPSFHPVALPLLLATSLYPPPILYS